MHKDTGLCESLYKTYSSLDDVVSLSYYFDEPSIKEGDVSSQ